jgi:hypothetical protein
VDLTAWIRSDRRPESRFGSRVTRGPSVARPAWLFSGDGGRPAWPVAEGERTCVLPDHFLLKPESDDRGSRTSNETDQYRDQIVGNRQSR